MTTARTPFELKGEAGNSVQVNAFSNSGLFTGLNFTLRVPIL